jgi:hypothetical protein
MYIFNSLEMAQGLRIFVVDSYIMSNSMHLPPYSFSMMYLILEEP